MKEMEAPISFDNTLLPLGSNYDNTLFKKSNTNFKKNMQILTAIVNVTLKNEWHLLLQLRNNKKIV